MIRPVLVLSLALSTVAWARTPIDEVLAKHSRWTLNVDGEVGTLEILGGSGQANPSGGFDLTADVTWKGAPGTLQGSADGLGLQYQVKLSVPRGGVAVNLEGYVAQDDDALMAGTVKGPGKKLGAWYAQLDAWMAEVRRLVLAGRKIDAVKLYREKTGASLAAAKAAVDAMIAPADAGSAPPPPPPPPPPPIDAGTAPTRGSCAVTVRVGGNVAMASTFSASISGPDGSRRVQKSHGLAGGAHTFDALPDGEYQIVMDTKADTTVTPTPSRSTMRCTPNARLQVEVELR